MQLIFVLHLLTNNIMASSMAIHLHSYYSIQKDQTYSYRATYLITVKVSLMGNFAGTSGCCCTGSPKLILALSE